jgi:hypothetical protein
MKKVTTTKMLMPIAPLRKEREVKASRKTRREVVVKEELTRPAATRVRERRGGKSELRPYLAALRDPFSPPAVGCRLPSPYPVATVTYLCKTTVPLVSDSAGNFQSAFFPNPFITAGIVIGSTTFPVAYASSPTMFGVATPQVVGSSLAAYRVVSAGFRIRNMQAPLSAVGSLRAATTPIVAYLPPIPLLSSAAVPAGAAIAVATGQGFSSTAGLAPFSGASLEELPDCEVVSIQSLLNSTMDIHLRPNAADCQRFRVTNTCDDWSGVAGPGVIEPLGFEWTAGSAGTVDTAGAGSTATGPSDSLGWPAALLYGEGLPSSTKFAEMDIVIHVEGPPDVTSSGVFEATAPPATCVGDLPSVLSAIGTAAVNVYQVATGNPQASGRDLIMGLLATGMTFAGIR